MDSSSLRGVPPPLSQQPTAAKTESGEASPKVAQGADTKSSHQAVKIAGSLDTNKTIGQMELVKQGGDTNFPTAKEVFGHAPKREPNQEDKKLIMDANLRLERHKQPSQAVLKILGGHEDIELEWKRNGELEIRLKGKNPNPDQIVEDLCEEVIKLRGEGLDLHDINEELTLFMISNKSLREALERKFGSDYIKFNYGDRQTQDFMHEQALKTINENGGRLMLVESQNPDQKSGLEFELCQREVQSGITTIKTLLDKFGSKINRKEFFKSILESPVLSPVLKNKEFWDSPVGKDFLKKASALMVLDAVPPQFAFELLEKSGDNLKLTASNKKSGRFGVAIYFPLSFDLKNEGEDHIDLTTVLRIIDNNHKVPNPATEERNIEELKGNNFINVACNHAGLNSFTHLNEIIETQAAAWQEAIGQEKIAQFNGYLATEEGRQWAKRVADATSESDVSLVPNMKLINLEEKPGSESIFNVTVEVISHLRIGEWDPTHKFFPDEKNESLDNLLKPTGFQLEIAGLGNSTRDAANLMLNVAKNKISSEKINISSEGKILSKNRETVQDQLEQYIEEKIYDPILKADKDIRDINCEIKITKTAINDDGTAQVKAELTPYWYKEGGRLEDPERFPPQVISMKLTDMTSEQWKKLESQLNAHQEEWGGKGIVKE